MSKRRLNGMKGEKQNILGELIWSNLNFLEKNWLVKNKPYETPEKNEVKEN